MATRSGTSFKKRQKELARVQKQQDKAAKKMERKLTGKQSGDSDIATADDLRALFGDDAPPETAEE